MSSVGCASPSFGARVGCEGRPSDGICNECNEVPIGRNVCFSHAFGSAALVRSETIVRTRTQEYGARCRNENSGAETGAAAARALGLRIEELEAGTVQPLDVVDLRAVEVLVADHVDVQRDALR